MSQDEPASDINTVPLAKSPRSNESETNLSTTDLGSIENLKHAKTAPPVKLKQPAKMTKNSSNGSNDGSKTQQARRRHPGHGRGRRGGRGPKNHGARGGHRGKRGHHPVKTFIDKTKAPEQLGEYKISKPIGKGAFGSVYKAMHQRELKVYAIKTIYIRRMNPQQQKEVESEVDLLASLPAHKNIVKYKDTIRTDRFFCIVLEYVDLGSLHYFMKEYSGKMEEKHVASFILQILCGLQFLHEQGIIHRDIKAANVLITNDGVAKLADFGVAIKNDDNAGNDQMAAEVAGSPYWMAPEIIEMRGQVTPACDIWAVGATAIELLTGHPPYHNLATMAALFRIVQDPHPDIPSSASKPLQEFLFFCFDKEPSRRPSAKQLQQHKWLLLHTDQQPKSPQSVAGALDSEQKDEEEDDDGDDTDPDTAELSNGLSAGHKTDILNQTMKVSKAVMANALKEQSKLLSTKKDPPTQRVTATFNNDGKTLTTNYGVKVPVNKPQAATSLSKESNLTQKNSEKKSGEKKGKTDKKKDKKKAAKPLSEDDEESSGWGSSDEDEEDSSDNSSSEDGDDDSESDEDDSDYSESDDNDDMDLDINADLDLNAFHRRFQDNDNDDPESDDDKWEVSDDEEDAMHQYEEGGKDKDNVHQILKRLDEQITFLQHIETHGLEAVPKEREDIMVTELNNLNDIFQKSPQLIGQCIKTAIIPIMEMLSIESEDVKCTALKTIGIIVADEKQGQQHLQTLCLVQFIPAIKKMVRVQSAKIKEAATPFLRKFCEDSDTAEVVGRGRKPKKAQPQTNFVRQMFIASGGIGILVECLRNKYNKVNEKIIYAAVDCIHAIFESKIHTRRDLARLFTKAGGLKRLLKVLHASLHHDPMMNDGFEEAIKYGKKMAHIFFSIASQTDRVVKTMISGTSEQTLNAMEMSSEGLGSLDSLTSITSMASMGAIPSVAARYSQSTNNVIASNQAAKPNYRGQGGGRVGFNGVGNDYQPRNGTNGMTNGQQLNGMGNKNSILAQLLGLLSALDKDKDPNGKRRDILLMILKSFGELSKDSNCIGPLIEAKTMSTVIPFLESEDEDIQYIVVLFLWNMTRVNNAHSIQARREAAENGAIPVLKRLLKYHTKLNKSVFLVETICKFPNGADAATLFEMKKHNMAQFYIDMTKNDEQFHGFSLDALTALARWIENPEYVQRLEFILCQPDNITQLIELFKSPIANMNSRNAVRSKNVSSILEAFKTLVKSPRISDALGDSNVFLMALGAWFQNDYLPPEIVNDLLKMLSEMLGRLTDNPASKKKCAKTILPIIDKVFEKGKKNGKYAVMHLIKKEVIPHISLHVDDDDIADLCPELREILMGTGHGSLPVDGRRHDYGLDSSYNHIDD